MAERFCLAEEVIMSEQRKSMGRGDVDRRPYQPPQIETETISETPKLGCGRLTADPGCEYVEQNS